tara:strand:- start:2119 stop:2490 length:372 start_codon:yes stop_codon:yes gene_type:complete
VELKRDLIKYIRDKAKSKYEKTDKCYICGSEERLDFHHFYSLTELFEEYMTKNNLNITTEEEILEVREKFIEEYFDKIYNRAVTICHKHHLKLHSIYGKKPKLVTAEKQERWVNIQRDKHGMV